MVQEVEVVVVWASTTPRKGLVGLMGLKAMHDYVVSIQAAGSNENEKTWAKTWAHWQLGGINVRLLVVIYYLLESIIVLPCGYALLTRSCVRSQFSREAVLSNQATYSWVISCVVGGGRLVIELFWLGENGRRSGL